MFYTVVYYSMHHVSPTFGFAVSPIDEKAHVKQAEAEAKTTVTITWGDLQIVLFVCCEPPDAEVYAWLNYVKEGHMLLYPDFRKSEYTEDLEGGYVYRP